MQRAPESGSPTLGFYDGCTVLRNYGLSRDPGFVVLELCSNPQALSVLRKQKEIPRVLSDAGQRFLGADREAGGRGGCFHPFGVTWMWGGKVCHIKFCKQISFILLFREVYYLDSYVCQIIRYTRFNYHMK